MWNACHAWIVSNGVLAIDFRELRERRLFSATMTRASFASLRVGEKRFPGKTGRELFQLSHDIGL